MNQLQTSFDVEIKIPLSTVRANTNDAAENTEAESK